MQYKKTTKNLRQIAKELGVDYILEGSIRWDKGGDTSRVRILPQLIRVSDDTHLWAQTYQRPLTDIFATQADIAGKIAEAMSITLLGSEQTTLRAIPTQNLDAYEAYLRGMDYFQRSEWNQQECQLGVQLMQRAVSLDSTFALAYAWLAMSHARMYHAGFDRTPDRLRQTKAALDRALELQPDLGQVHIALSYYYYWGFRDYDRALNELSIAEPSLPNESQINELRGYIWRRQGQFQAAVQQLKQSFLLSPLNSRLALELGSTYNMIRDFELADEFSSLSISLEPDYVDAYATKAWTCYAWRRDTSSARSILESIPNQDDDDTRVAWCYLHLFERDYPAALEQLAHLPAVLDRMLSDFTPRSLLEGMVYRLLGESDKAQTAFNSARVILEKELKARPEDHRVHGSLGIVYAGLGRKEDAIHEGKLGVELFPVSKDAYFGHCRLQDLAQIYLMVGEYDLALDQIEYLLSIPADFSINELGLDPRFDPLRNLPRYRKLVEKYGS
jgi:tetratricopeptide (TPR) repeat protein